MRGMTAFENGALVCSNYKHKDLRVEQSRLDKGLIYGYNHVQFNDAEVH